MDQHYMRLLAREYPTREAAAAEAIRLGGILRLPKETEYFFSDLHGEFEAFSHLLRSASGYIRLKLDELFGSTLTEKELDWLCNLIYYPETESHRFRHEAGGDLTVYRTVVDQLIALINAISAKYTRSYMRKKLPPDWAGMIDELLHGNEEYKSGAIQETVRGIYQSDMMPEFLQSLALTIQRLAIDRIHILGDVYDRGPRPDKIMDALMGFQEVDFQWGNHDILWMGAAAGSRPCMANVVRQGVKYNNFDVLEGGYNINLRPLAVFAQTVYGDDPCTHFWPKKLYRNRYNPVDAELAAKMHKAISVIGFKLEGQLMNRHPEYGMADRRLWEQVDWTRRSLTLDGNEVFLRDSFFPTVDPADPLALTDEEGQLVETIITSFRHSQRLKNHVRFLHTHGSMYRVYNGNLLYHGCVPLNPDGTFAAMEVEGQTVSGQALLDAMETVVRRAHWAPAHTPEQYKARDFLWYLWCGQHSPLYGKDRITTFERTFLEDKQTHKEQMNPYYGFLDDRDVIRQILGSFGLDPEQAHIINGHVPVSVRKGQSPVRGEGQLFLIDGGISKAYQETTGIGGYTLIYNSRYLALAEHDPFVRDTADRPVDLTPRTTIVHRMKKRVTVGDTDDAREILREKQALEELAEAYRTGGLRELSYPARGRR